MLRPTIFSFSATTVLLGVIHSRLRVFFLEVVALQRPSSSFDRGITSEDCFGHSLRRNRKK